MKRRNFLKSGMGAVSSAACRDTMKTLFASLVQGVIDEAVAGPSGQEASNYLFLQIEGGVARHAFDLWLEGYADSGVRFDNHCIVTNYKNPSAGGAQEYRIPEYRTFDYTVPSHVGGGVLRLPYLWGHTIPTINGGSVPMTSILSNMMVLMGATMPNDGHPNNQVKTQLLDGAAFTPAGAILDRVFEERLSVFLPVLGVGSSSASRFKSRSHLSIPQVENTNSLRFGAYSSGDTEKYLQRAFDAVIDPNADSLLRGVLTRRDALDAWVAAGLVALRQVTESIKGPSSGIAFELRHTAETTLRTGLNQVLDYYFVSGNGNSSGGGVLAKYRDLCDRVLDTRIALINDKPVRSSRPGWDNVHGFIGKEEVVWTDICDMVHGSPNLEVIHLPESFALAEALFNTGYSKVVLSYYPTFLNGMKCGPDATERTAESDGHASHPIPQIQLDRVLSQSLAACMHEFRNAVQNFDQTVVQISSEFVRAPDSVWEMGNDGTPFRHLGNSAHGWQGNIGSFFSGKIVGPFAVGFVEQGIDPSTVSDNPADPQFLDRYTPGTWGAAGCIPSDISHDIGVSKLRIDHVISQACELLGVPSPAPNFQAPVPMGPDGTFRLSHSVIGKYRIVP